LAGIRAPSAEGPCPLVQPQRRASEQLCCAQISNLGAIPNELKPGYDASSAQSAGGAPSRLEEAGAQHAPPLALTGGAGHAPPMAQYGGAGSAPSPDILASTRRCARCAPFHGLKGLLQRVVLQQCNCVAIVRLFG